MAAVKEKHAMKPPTKQELKEWGHHERPVTELQEMQRVLDKVKALASNTSSSGYVDERKGGRRVGCYAIQPKRQWPQGSTGGALFSTNHLVSLCNPLIRSEDRNLLGRFETARDSI